MKNKRYFFALKMKDGTVKRFYTTSNDPFEKVRYFYKKYESTVDEVVFKEVK